MQAERDRLLKEGLTEIPGVSRYLYDFGKDCVYSVFANKYKKWQRIIGYADLCIQLTFEDEAGFKNTKLFTRSKVLFSIKHGCKPWKLPTGIYELGENGDVCFTTLRDMFERNIQKSRVQIKKSDVQDWLKDTRYWLEAYEAYLSTGNSDFIFRELEKIEPKIKAYLRKKHILSEERVHERYACARDLLLKNILEGNAKIVSPELYMYQLLYRTARQIGKVRARFVDMYADVDYYND